MAGGAFQRRDALLASRATPRTAARPRRGRRPGATPDRVSAGVADPARAGHQWTQTDAGVVLGQVRGAEEACRNLPSSAIASSTPGMRNFHSGTLAFTPLFVRSTTERAGYGVPSRLKALWSEGRMAMCSAEHMEPSGSIQTPSSNAWMASILSM